MIQMGKCHLTTLSIATQQDHMLSIEHCQHRPPARTTQGTKLKSCSFSPWMFDLKKSRFDFHAINMQMKNFRLLKNAVPAFPHPRQSCSHHYSFPMKQDVFQHSSSTETSYFSTPKDILRHRLHSHCATSPWYHSLLPEEKNVISMLSDRPEIFFSQVNQIHSIMSVMTWSPTWCSKTALSTCQCNPPSRHRPPWYGLTWLQCSIQQLFFLVVQCSSLLLGPSSGTKMMDGVIQPSVILVHHFCSWGNPEQQVKTLVPIWS